MAPPADGTSELGVRWRRGWRQASVAHDAVLAAILDEPDPQAARLARIVRLSQDIARLREELEALPSIESIDERTGGAVAR